MPGRQNIINYCIITTALFCAIFLFPAPLKSQIGNLPSPVESSDYNPILQKILDEKWATPHAIIKKDGHLKTRSIEDTKYTDNSDPDISEGEPYLTINPNDPNHLVVSFMELDTELDFPIFYSFDGGFHWERSTFRPNEQFAQDFPDLIIAGGGDPILAFDNDGDLYFSWIYLGLDVFEGNIVTHWAHSQDGGAHFNLASEGKHILEQGIFNLLTGDISGEIGEGILDRPWFAVDHSDGWHADMLYCMGLFLPKEDSKLEESGIVLRKKYRDRDTFEMTQTQISVTANAQFSNLVVDKNGDIHMSYINLDDQKLMYAQSTDGGTSINFQIPVSEVVQDSFETLVHDRENPAPSLAVSNASNDLYLVWSDFQDSTVVGMFSHSEDGGVIWSVPKDINSLLNIEDHQILMPGVMTNESGEVVIHWYELDSTDAGTYRMAFSDDAAKSFRNIIDISSDTTPFQSYEDEVAFFGDYYRSDYVGDFAHFIWSDGRDSQGAKVYYKRVNARNPSVSIGQISPVTDQFFIAPISLLGQDQISIRLESKISTEITFSLINATGQKITQWSEHIVPGELQIEKNISALASGVYYLSAAADVGIFTRSFFRQ